MTLSVSFHNPVSVAACTVERDDGKPSFACLRFIDAQGNRLPIFFDDIRVAYALEHAFQAATGAILPAPDGCEAAA